MLAIEVGTLAPRKFRQHSVAARIQVSKPLHMLLDLPMLQQLQGNLDKSSLQEF